MAKFFVVMTYLHTTPEKCLCELIQCVCVCSAFLKNCACVCEWYSVWCSVCGLNSVCAVNCSVMCGV